MKGETSAVQHELVHFEGYTRRRRFTFVEASFPLMREMFLGFFVILLRFARGGVKHMVLFDHFRYYMSRRARRITL